MAISREDGSIILKTKIDDSGLKKGFTKMKDLTKKASKSFAVIGAATTAATIAITKMAVSAYADYEQLVGGVETLFKGSAGKVLEYASQAFKNAGVSANEYMQSVTSFSASLISSLAGDTEKAADIANMALIDISDNANKMGSDIASITTAYQGFAKGQYMLLDNLKLGYGGTKTEMERLLKDAEAFLATQGKTAKFSIDNLADVYTAINAIQKKLGIAGATAKEAETTISGSFGMAKAAWQNLLTAMSGGGDLDRAINDFVYSIEKFAKKISPVIESTLIGLGKAVEKSLPMLVQTVATALVRQIPNLVVAVYQMIVGLFSGIVQGIKALFTGKTADITGVISDNISAGSDSANSLAENMKKTAEETSKAGKEAKKTLAAFDDLNILSSGKNDSSEASAPTPSVVSAGGSLEESGLTGAFQSYAAEIDAELTAIMAIAGEVLVAIGLLLLFFGQIAMGIGFIIVGALTFNVAAANSAETGYAKEVVGILTTIMGFAGGALLALGIILLYFGGVVGKGTAIGLIIAGASLIVSAVATKAAFTPDDIGGWLSLIMGIAGGALLALGIILCMVGSIPIGVGMIIAGSVALVSAVALNFDSVKNLITGWVAGIMIIAGAALLVLGIVLTASGANLILGIALIAAGAIALATPIALNWNAIKDAISKFITENDGLIIGVASALLVLGIVLCLCGVITPLSIGLIVAGAGILTAEIALNPEATKNAITKFITENTALIVGISLAILVLGIVLCCFGIITPLTIGMIVFGATGLVTEIALNWNAIKDAMSKFFQDNAGLIIGVSLALLVLGVVLLFTGVGIPLAIGLIVAGAAGLAATVALNWNYIKDKTVKIFNNIIDWVKTWGLLILGIILVVSGIGIPLGIALMKKAGANLTEAQDPLWNTIVEKVKGVWNAIKMFWNTHIAKWFTKEHWANLAKNMMNGLISKIEEGLNKILQKFHNSGIGEALDYVAGGLGFNIPKSIKIPRLAKGAVIPPNREFLAVLGDQKSGTNIEAPLQTIVDAFNIALANGGGGGSTEVILEVDGREFGRAVVEQGSRESRRIGTRLVIA